MLRAIQAGLLILLCVAGAWYFFTEYSKEELIDFATPDLKIVRIGEATLHVSIADTPELHQKGLSGVSELPFKTGMLFVFDTVDNHGIWMKDMLMPIDIIWIDAEYRVVGIEQDVNPKTYPKVFRPPVPVKYVIETDASYTETFGVRVGDSVSIP